MEGLLHLLEHPHGVAVARRMLNSSIAEKQPQYDSYSSLCVSCAVHSDLLQAHPMSCESHLNCILLRLLSSALRTTPDGRMEEVLEFCMLSPTAQNNLLLLLQTERYKIPSHIMKSFLDTIEDHCGTDLWSTFLLQQLKMPETFSATSADTGVAKTTAVFTGLSVNMLDQAQAMGDKLQAELSTSSGIQLTNFPSFFIRDFSQPEFPFYIPGTAPEMLVKAGESKRRRVDIISVEKPQHEFVISHGDAERRETFISMQDQAVMQRETVMQFPVAAAETLIPQELLCVIQQIKEKWCSGHAISSETFDYLMSLSRKKINEALQLAEIDFSEATAIAVLYNLTSSVADLSHHGLSTLLEMIILRMLLVLQQCASRPLLSALSSFVVKYPTAAILELLLPFIKNKKFGPAHADLLSSLLKDVMMSEQRDLFWRNFISSSRDTEEEPFVWSEDILTVIHVLLEKKVQLNCELVVPLVEVLQKNSGFFRTSPKFAKLLIKLVNEFHEKLKPVSALMEIATAHRSIAKSALIKCVEKLTAV